MTKELRPYLEFLNFWTFELQLCKVTKSRAVCVRERERERERGFISEDFNPIPKRYFDSFHLCFAFICDRLRCCTISAEMRRTKMFDNFRSSEFLNDNKECVPRVVMYLGIVFRRGDGKHSVNAQDLYIDTTHVFPRKNLCDIYISSNASLWICRRKGVGYFF